MYFVGAVPPFYREVYEILCPNQEPVLRETFVKFLAKSGLSSGVLTQVGIFHKINLVLN